MNEFYPKNQIELFDKSASTQPSTPDSRDLSPISSRDNLLSIPDALTTDTSYVTFLHQKKIGCCTMASLVRIFEHLEYKRTGVYVQYSVRFAYTVLKKFIDGNTTEGSSMRNALKAMQKYGTVPESMYPSDFTLSHSEFISMANITDSLLTEALKHRIGAYFRGLNDKSLIPMYIAKYGLVYARFECGDSWYTNEDGNVTWLESEISPLRKPTKVESGHAVIIDGYDIENYKTWILNSWSKAWAVFGRNFYFPQYYQPTEIWLVTLDPVPVITGVNTPVDTSVIEESVWRKMFDIFRTFKIIK